MIIILDDASFGKKFVKEKYTFSTTKTTSDWKLHYTFCPMPYVSMPDWLLRMNNETGYPIRIYGGKVKVYIVDKVCCLFFLIDHVHQIL